MAANEVVRYIMLRCSMPQAANTAVDQFSMHRFSDNYAWFLEYRSVLPIECRYTAIARKILFTSLISMRTYLVRCLRDSIRPVLAACGIEQRSIMYLNNYFISRHDGERAPQICITVIELSRSISVTMNKA